MIGYQDIAVAACVLLALCGAVSVVGSAVDRLRQWRKPSRDNEKTLQAHSRMLDNDNKRLKDLETGNNLLIKGMMQLMTHEIDGNHVDKLQQARDEMQQYLIDR